MGAGWAGDLNQPSSQSGEGGDAVAVLAAVTSAGNVELITLQRGALTPLSSAISVSLGMPVSAHLQLMAICNLSMFMTRESLSGSKLEHPKVMHCQAEHTKPADACLLLTMVCCFSEPFRSDL